jgi:hypothetical protein
VRTCVAGACAVAGCEVGYDNCDGAAGNGCEVDTDRDVDHCGACATRCAAMQACRTGACMAASMSCADGRADCAEGAEVCETATVTDPLNCGGCGRVCAFAHAAATCAAGMCVRGDCEAGWGDCDGDPADGCETRTATDPSHCGACGRACVVANGTAACAAGVCAVAACAAGFGDCDGSPSDGCEADLGASAAHCGGCGRACAPAHATGACAAGTCTIASCAAGFADCDGSAASGCEAETATDPARCGGCATVCGYPHAASSCAAGACVFGACEAGWGNCDGAAANGCEANLATSASTCGACGRACAFDHAAASCAAGVCAIGACEAGWGDCDGNPANGCETALASSAAHCGACGRACPAGQACGGGACVLTCPTGQQACGSACVNLNNDPAHCGGCGRVCPSGPNQRGLCRGATCYTECDPRYGDCDGAAANGCEASLDADRRNCGGCGVACASAPNAEGGCDLGVCRLACATSYVDCDGAAANGCEVAINTDVNNCGGCGLSCRSVGSSGRHVRGSTCRVGACALVCDDGWADCNRVGLDGCEASLSAPTSCGSCLRTCGAGGLGISTACCPRAGGNLCCTVSGTLANVCAVTNARCE